jgi:hypothetical protein
MTNRESDPSAFRRGAEAMREMAAQMVLAVLGQDELVLSGAIRALPLPAETPDPRRPVSEIRAEIKRLIRDIPAANKGNWMALGILIGRHMALEWTITPEPKP